MSLTRFIETVTAALFFSSATLFAGPRITIGDPPPGTPVGLTFSFQANPLGGGVFAFTNTSGIDWSSVDLQVTASSGTSITCDPGPFFTSCESSVLVGGPNTSLFDVGFDQPSNLGGIKAGSDFTINLNDLIGGTRPNPDPDGAGQWGPNTPFAAFANEPETVPEPASKALVAIGLALVAFPLLRAVSSRPKP